MRDATQEGGRAPVEVPLAHQAEVAREFLAGLLERLGFAAEISLEVTPEDLVDIRVTGRDLGLLIGPKGSTLAALQDLTRTVVQHRTGATNGRIVLDVSGYRQRRTEALVSFTERVAANVLATGTRTVLEPMTAADRKVVHDTVAKIEGVTTTSEGEEPRRRVVIIPQR